MVSYNASYWIIFFLFLSFGIYSFYEDDNIQVDIKDRLLEQTKDSPMLTVFYVKLLDDLTPSRTLFYEEKPIYGINQFPLISFSHSIIMSAIIILTGVLMHHFKVGLFKQIITLILVAVVSYYIASLIIYATYMIVGKILGFTFAESENIRITYNSGFDKVLVPLFIASGIAILSIIKSIYSNAKRN